MSTMPWIGLLPALLLIAAIPAAFLIRRLIGRYASLRRPEARHPLVRIVCATLAGGILLSVAIASWRDAHVPYRVMDAGATLMVKVSPHPRPPFRLDLDPSAGKWRPVANARFLLRVFVGAMTPAGFSAHQAREWDVRWPLPKREEFSGTWSGGGQEVDYAFAIDRLMDAEVTDHHGRTAQVLVANVEFHCSSHSSTSSRSSSGGGEISEAGRLEDLDLGIELGGGPLSITSPAAGPIALLAVLTPLTMDETVVEQPVGDFLAPYQERLLSGHTVRNLGRARYNDQIPMRGLALAVHLGLSSLPLLAAALLLVQCFANRQLALAGALFGVVLFVALLDRVVVGVHLARLADPRESVEHRLLAGSCLRDSFFHRATAARQLRAVVEDRQAPEPLRVALAQIADSLAAAQSR